MRRESRGSTAFLLVCIDCDGALRVRDCDSGFEAARTAGTARGWSFAKGLERCGACTKRATVKAPATRGKAKTSTKR